MIIIIIIIFIIIIIATYYYDYHGVHDNPSRSKRTSTFGPIIQKQMDAQPCLAPGLPRLLERWDLNDGINQGIINGMVMIESDNEV